ncbi:hypothetical protein D9613_000264 [Agrocybe pediades]|uniref:Uncharacterized protein n=1 Tax=Agrocybe pediades TaxID=84607 RepID=A0A8H4R2T4_9AGAR|nr:hypothetical protein D9613_000264 [Agrocybe pediades]
MSVVSSILSTRTPGWRISVRLASLMDSVFAIGFGLGLRFVVDTVSHHDFKLTGTLVGLWEGVILLHFLKKMPKSSDPYIAYGVRLFVDFLFTESVARLVLVLIWTALGMVLADVTPAIWDEVGLKRIWKRFRRDIYTLTQMIPTVAFFPPARTVRFSPSRAPSVVSEARSGITPSVAPTGMTPTTTDAVPPSEPPPAPRRQVVKRRLPGYFSMDTTDTETDSGSVVSVGTFGGITGRTSRRLSVYPGRMDFDSQSSTPSQNDLDEGNISDTSSNVTERAPYSGIPDPESIPDMELEEPLLIDVTAAPVKHEEGEVTPKGQKNFYMPPTPSDSAARWPREVDEAPLPVPSGSMPEIPDFLEESNTEDWEKIQRADYTDDNDKPPTPPAKDDLPAAYKKVESNTPPDDLQNWDTMESQIISPPINNDDNAHENDNNNNNTNDNNDEYPEASTSAAATNRQSQPPPYDYDNNELDDIYVSDPPRQEKARFEAASGDLLGGDNEYGVPPPATNGQDEQQQRDLDDVFGGGGGNRPLSDLNFGASNPWGRGFAAQALEVEAARQKELEEEAEREREKREKEEKERVAAEEAKRVEEERKRKEEEEKRIKEAEEAAQREEEERKKKKAEEKAERLRKEAEDEAARKKKREEEAEATRVKKEEKKKKKAAEEEAKRKAEEEAEKKRVEEEAEAKRQEEAERQRVKAEQQEMERKMAQEQLERERIEQEEEAQRRKQAAESEEALKKAQEEEKDKATREEVVKSLGDVISPEEQAADEAAANGGRTPTPKHPQTELPAETEPEQLVNVDADVDADAHGEDDHVDQAGQVDLFSDAASAAPSEMPELVRDRLHRAILTKAQTAELEDQIADLSSKLDAQEGDAKAATENTIRTMQKTIRKLRRKEDRRAQEVPPPKFFGDKFKNDTEDITSLEKLQPRDAETKIEEKMESLLLGPDIKSLHFQLKIANGNPGKKIIPNVTETLDRYCLIPYTTDDKSGARHKHINVPEGQFNDWLLSYRQAVAAPEADEDEYGY